ncbi:MAG: M20/M25/M40 family metallo-hydrolase [Bacteroidales bacterium]
MKPSPAYETLLMDMLAIPAVSRKENARADFLEQRLRGMGFPVQRFHNNLLVGEAESRPHRPLVLLNSHIDTVAPVEGWTDDPFLPRSVGDRITGLGSNDAGASVVTLIETFRLWQSRPDPDLRLLLLLSAEEEVSGDKGLSSVWPELPTPDAVMVGEPTGMHPAVAERGLMVLDGTVEGKAGHAARKEGENAIYKALADVAFIEQLAFPKASEWLPAPGAQVTMISAGSAHNVVPDVCRYVVDVRSNDMYTNEALLDLLRAGCRGTLVPRSMRLRSSSLKEDHPLMQAVHTCGMKPFGSATLSDMALIPVPALKMGPGDSARSHTAGEYILRSELAAGVEEYTRFLRALARVYRDRPSPTFITS